VVPQQILTGFASWLHYCSDVAQRRPTKLCTIFGRLLGWYTIYTFWGFRPLTEFCPVQNSLCVQILRSRILAALLHGTSVSQTLRRGTRNGITELSQRAPPIFGWAAITLEIGPHCSCFLRCMQTSHAQYSILTRVIIQRVIVRQLECGPMPNVMAALPNIDDTLCSNAGKFG